MGEIEPASDDASLPTVLVHRTDGLAHRPLERTQPTAGINPAIAGVLINRSKEPDAGPHVRFCEKHGGVILRAYSTRSPSEVRPAPAAHFSPRGQCGLAVVSDWVKCLIRLEIEGSAIARPSHHRPPDEA